MCREEKAHKREKETKRMPIRLKSLLLRPFFCISRSCAAPPPPDLTPPFPYGRFKGPGRIKIVNGFGCDNNHWLIEVKKPVVGSRDEIIDGYIQLVAQVLGSEDEARKQIYSVSTKYYFAVGVLVSRDVADKFKQLPDVVDVTRDAYVDIATKDYGGEPFVDGKPVPYDPKHHAFYHRAQAIFKTSDREKEAMLKATFKAWKWDPLGDGETSESEKENGKQARPRASIINIRNAEMKRRVRKMELKMALELAEERRRWALKKLAEEEKEEEEEAEERRRRALKLLVEEVEEECQQLALKLAEEEQEEEERQQLSQKWGKLALKWGKSKNVSSSPGRVTMG